MRAKGFRFDITARDARARSGTLRTPHGAVASRVFMSVATYGAVRGIAPADLHALSRPVQLPVRINTVIATLDLDGNGGVDADELRRSMQND